MHTDAEMLALLTSAHDEDTALARAHAPLIHFDAAEPFLPLAAGYTVFRANAPSPSFPRTIELPEGAALAIEYAIWWDWDIEHLYELEHVWVYLDEAGNLLAADASWHGGWNAMALEAMLQKTAIASEDCREGVMALMQKRKPEFKGR